MVSQIDKDRDRLRQMSSALPRANKRDRKLTSTPVLPSDARRKQTSERVTVFDRPKQSTQTPSRQRKTSRSTTNGKKALQRAHSSPGQTASHPQPTPRIANTHNVVPSSQNVAASNKSSSAGERAQSQPESSISPRFTHIPPNTRLQPPPSSNQARVQPPPPRVSNNTTTVPMQVFTPRGPPPVQRMQSLPGTIYHGSPPFSARVSTHHNVRSPPPSKIPSPRKIIPTPKHVSHSLTPRKTTTTTITTTTTPPATTRKNNFTDSNTIETARQPQFTRIITLKNHTFRQVSAGPSTPVRNAGVQPLSARRAYTQPSHHVQQQQPSHYDPMSMSVQHNNNMTTLPLQPPPVTPSNGELENLLMRLQSQVQEEKKNRHIAQDRARKAEGNYSNLLNAHQEMVRDKENLQHDHFELQQQHDSLTSDFFESQEFMKSISAQNMEKDHVLQVMNHQLQHLQEERDRLASVVSSPYNGRVLSRSASSSPNRTRLILPQPTFSLASASQSTEVVRKIRYVRATGGFNELASELDILESQLIKRHEEGRGLLHKLHIAEKFAETANQERERLMMAMEDHRSDRVLPYGGHILRGMWEEALGKYMPNSIAFTDFSKFGVFFVEGVAIESKLSYDHKQLLLKSDGCGWMAAEAFFKKLKNDISLRHAHLALSSDESASVVNSSVSGRPSSSPFTQYTTMSHYRSCASASNGSAKSQSLSQTRRLLPSVSILLPFEQPILTRRSEGKENIMRLNLNPDGPIIRTFEKDQ